MERAMRNRCFFRPKAKTITSPVGGREGGRGRVVGAGEDGVGEEGSDGGGGGQGHGEGRGDGGDVMVQGERPSASRYEIVGE